MTSIEALCERIELKSKSIRRTNELIAEIHSKDMSTAQILDEGALDEYEQLQTLVIALGDLLLPPSTEDETEEGENDEQEE